MYSAGFTEVTPLATVRFARGKLPASEKEALNKQRRWNLQKSQCKVVTMVGKEH